MKQAPELMDFYETTTEPKKKLVLEILNKLSGIKGYLTYRNSIWGDVVFLVETGSNDTTYIEKKLASLVKAKRSKSK